MKNVTVTLDEEVARWARVAAAEADMSLSRFLGELLRREMEAREAYEAAMRANLARPPVPLKGSGGYPPREERHGRPLFRR